MNHTPHRRRRIVQLLCGLIIVAGCAAPQQEDGARSLAPATVVDHTWEWVETKTPHGSIEVAKPARYTMRLKHNGEAQLRFDCNHGGSFYEISDGRLSFGPLTATRIPCPEGSRGPVYMEQLGAVHGFYTESGFLYLELPADSGTMRFRRADSG